MSKMVFTSIKSRLQQTPAAEIWGSSNETNTTFHFARLFLKNVHGV